MKITYKTSLLLILCFGAVNVFAQQTDRDKGIELYQQKDYKGALKILKKSTGKEHEDAQGWYFLGLTYLKLEDAKSAIKPLQKAALLKPDDAQTKTVLAYAFLVRNDQVEADKEAREALKLNPNIAESHYILGVLAFRNASYNIAYEKAQLAIKLNPMLGTAYLLKSECLVASFTKLFGTVDKGQTSKSEMLKEAAQDLEKFLNLAGNIKEANYYREYLDSIQFFTGYYAKTEAEAKQAAADPAASKTELSIKSKPRANYTEKAREAGISGTVTLLVCFDADRKVKHVLILNPLGYGLNEEAVNAARHVTFDPATENGQPVYAVKRIQYSFTIY